LSDCGRPDETWPSDGLPLSKRAEVLAAECEDGAAAADKEAVERDAQPPTPGVEASTSLIPTAAAAAATATAASIIVPAAIAVFGPAADVVAAAAALGAIEGHRRKSTRLEQQKRGEGAV